MPVILPCFNAADLGRALARAAKADLVKYESRKFPDGELLVRIRSPINGKEVALVQSGYPKPNNAIMELLFAADAANDAGASSLTAVLPYFPYARQDERFNEGESFSLKTVFTLLRSMSVKKVVTVDAHFRDNYGSEKMFRVENINVSAGSLLVDHVKKKFKVTDLHVLSPDLGASGLVDLAAKEGKAHAVKLEKIREGDFEVSMKGDLNVKGKNVLVLDDMISTGGTMLLAMKKARKAGARRVFAAATHGIFGWDALNALQKEADYVYTTDSIPNEVSSVSLANVLAREL